MGQLKINITNEKYKERLDSEKRSKMDVLDQEIDLLNDEMRRLQGDQTAFNIDPLVNAISVISSKRDEKGREKRKLGGSVTTAKMPNDWQVLSIQVEREVNKIASAQLILIDGDTGSNADFKISSTTFFQLGETIKIEVEQDDGRLVFEGLVVKHQIKMDAKQGLLVVDLKHPAFKHTGTRHNRVHLIKKGEGSNTGITLVQHYCTDWDYLLCLTELSGKWVVTDQEGIKVIGPGLEERSQFLKNDLYKFSSNDTDGIKYEEVREVDTNFIEEITLPISYGARQKEIISFQMEMNGNDLYANFTTPPPPPPPPEAEAYPLVQLPVTAPEKVIDREIGKGGHEIPESALKNLGREKYNFFHSVGFNDKDWKTAQAIKSRYSAYKGRIEVLGGNYKDMGGRTEEEDAIYLGKLLNIKQIAKRFNGNTPITSLHHTIDEKGWFLDIGFGLSAEWHIDKHPDVLKPPAAGLTPGIRGLQIGEIADPANPNFKENEAESDHNSKLDHPNNQTVNIKLYNEKQNIVGTKINKGRNNINYPSYNINEGVILAFYNDNPNNAVILGQVKTDLLPTLLPAPTSLDDID